MIIVNKYQTELTDKVLNDMAPYVKEELTDAIERIEFIQKLASPTRPKAKNLPRWDKPFSKNRKEDPNGRICPNYEEPHILENMDYFRQAALHFQEHGRYTFAFPSKHPNSEFQRFWKEEARRCMYGYVRESDGEWITGYNYYYWNYSPIMLAIAKGDAEVSDSLDFEGQTADRVEDFPAVWDMDYFYYHYLEEAEKQGKFGTVLKTRGRGYSFKGGSLLARNYNFIPKSKSWALASEKGDLTEDGLLSKAWDNLEFINEHTAWRKRKQEKDTMMHKKASYKDLNTGVFKGIKSEIIGVTTQNKPEKARGKRGKCILMEEAGRYPDLLKVWGIARPSMEQGSLVYGLMIAFGTGGTEGAAFEGLEKLFYEGGGYRVLMKKNVFDKTRGEGQCAFYCGEYMNREGFYDKDGNSDVIGALIQTFNARLEVLKSTSDPMTIVQEKADRSITPQEAVMRTEGTIFPIGDLKDYLAEIKPNVQKFASSHHTGRLNLTNLGVDFVYDKGENVLREFPANTRKDKSGAVEIYVMPQRTENNEVRHGRYIMGVDPYDDDSGTSLGSAFVFDMYTDKIVAEYTGRPKFANDFYEIVRRLAIFYNAAVNYENKNKGLFGYFSNKHSLHLLTDNPKFLKDSDTTQARESYGNKAKGTHPTKEINALARRLQRDWMLSTAYNEETLPNLRKIRSVAYIQELIAWNPDGNFDRVSAMGMVMILREERLKYVEAEMNAKKVNPMASHKFWDDNY